MAVMRPRLLQGSNEDLGGLQPRILGGLALCLPLPPQSPSISRVSHK